MKCEDKDKTRLRTGTPIRNLVINLLLIHDRKIQPIEVANLRFNINPDY